MAFYKTAVSGNDTVPTDSTGSDAFPMDKTGTDTVPVDETGIDIFADTETLVLYDDAYPFDYIAATNTCIAFGVFFLTGLILAKMAWGRLK